MSLRPPWLLTKNSNFTKIKSGPNFVQDMRILYKKYNFIKVFVSSFFIEIFKKNCLYFSLLSLLIVLFFFPSFDSSLGDWTPPSPSKLQFLPIPSRLLLPPLLDRVWILNFRSSPLPPSTSLKRGRAANSYYIPSLVWKVVVVRRLWRRSERWSDPLPRWTLEFVCLCQRLNTFGAPFLVTELNFASFVCFKCFWLGFYCQVE